MKPMPAKVNRGLPCSHHKPFHSGAALGIMAMLRWRTATPFGRPVVPEVYMMSARSPASTGTWNVDESPSKAPPVDIVTFNDGTASARASAMSESDGEKTIAVASAWVSKASSSDRVSLVLSGTATAPALFMPAYDSTHRRA